MERVFQYYKKNLNYYNHVFKYMKLNLVLYCLGVFASASMFMWLSILNRLILALFFSATIFIGNFLVLNWQVKKTVMKKYKIKSKKIRWNDTIVENFFREKDKSEIIEELHKEGLDKKISQIIKIFEDRAKIHKFKFPVIPSLFAALTVSLWNNMFSWLFSRDYFNTLEKMLKLSGLGICLIIMLWGFYIFLEGFFRIVLLETLDKNYYKMKGFIRLLQEIKLEMEDE